MNIKVPDPFPRYRSPTKTPRLQGNKTKMMKKQNENKPVQKEAPKKSSEKKLRNENNPVGFPI